MRGRLEKASADLREPKADQTLIYSTLADLDDVLRMFASLTRISQIEATRRTSAFNIVNLLDTAGAVVELFDAAAEERSMQIEAVGQQPVFITGDRDLLFDAIANLVDNAIKHGCEGGKVIVTVVEKHGSAGILIADDGPGIPRDEHSHVFRRFYRLERSRCMPGNGLGLSLVAAVARLHGARILLLDNKPGLAVELWFPSSEACAAKPPTL
jgi:signal transduction histidine kinase